MFKVRDAQAAFDLLEARGATPIGDVVEHRDHGGTLKTFSVTTPLGSTTFRFVERRGYAALRPGFVALPTTGPSNRYGFERFDHVTSNFETMKPALLWMGTCWGFSLLGGGLPPRTSLSAQATLGLRSQVMWDPAAAWSPTDGARFPPHRSTSRRRSARRRRAARGVDHGGYQGAVRGMRAGGVLYADPGDLHDALPERLLSGGIGVIDEDLDGSVQILVDGDRERSYLLQIFLQEGASYHGEERAGPFFYEVIQRKGDAGFGAGNFRALFESIERAQVPGGPY